MNHISKALLTFFLVSWGSVVAQEKAVEPKGKISGHMFGDVFYNVRQNDKSKQDLNGVQFRRVYFTYDHAISEAFDSRFRLEADQSANTSNGKIGVFVKDAYLKWKNVLPGSDFFFGISPTPAFEVSEDHWGYRSLEKTILDLRGIVSARDLGVDLKGRIDPNSVVRYWVKLGDNSGNTPETDKYKRYYGQLHFKINSRIQATAYGDLDSRPKTTDSFDGRTKNNNRFVTAGFISVREESKYSVGVEGFYRVIQNNFRSAPGLSLVDQKTFGVTGFAWVAVNDLVRLVGRYDFYDPNSDVDTDGNLLFIGAIDYMPSKNVHVMPNIEVQTYQASNTTNDIVGRVTFYYIFK